MRSGVETTNARQRAYRRRKRAGTVPIIVEVPRDVLATLEAAGVVKKLYPADKVSAAIAIEAYLKAMADFAFSTSEAQKWTRIAK